MAKTGDLIPQCKIIVTPILASAFAALVWYFLFFRLHLNVGKDDETALTNTLIPVLATFHAILAAAVLSKVWEEFKQIRHCILKMDEQGFSACLDDRIPFTIHLLLAAMSLLIVFSAMLVEYQHASAGLLVVGGLTFVLTLYWEVATNLDNPLSGAWYINRVPPSWIKMRPVQPVERETAQSSD